MCSLHQLDIRLRENIQSLAKQMQPTMMDRSADAQNICRWSNNLYILQCNLKNPANIHRLTLTQRPSVPSILTHHSPSQVTYKADCLLVFSSSSLSISMKLIDDSLMLLLLSNSRLSVGASSFCGPLHWL